METSFAVLRANDTINSRRAYGRVVEWWWWWEWREEETEEEEGEGPCPMPAGVLELTQTL